MKKSNILLIFMAALVVVALIFVLTRPTYAFTITNNGQEVNSLDIIARVNNGVCSATTYNSSCDLVSNRSEDNKNSVMVYQKLSILQNNLNKSFLDSNCNKINSTTWECKENYIIQEVKK